MRGGGGLHHLLHHALHVVAHGLIQGADGAVQGGVVRNDVTGAAGVELRDAQHGGGQRVGAAGHDALQRQHDVRADDHRVYAAVRTRCVAAAGLDADPETVAGGGHLASRGLHGANWQRRVVMGAKHHVAGEAVEQPFLDHHAPAAAALLGGLEDEVDGAVEVAGLGQVLGRPQQHGGVPVMATGVHAVGGRGAVREVVVLSHLKAVHVSAKADGAWGGAGVQSADQAGAGDATGDGDAPGLQLGGDDGAGTVLVEAKLRMGVQVAAPLGQDRGEVGDAVLDRHGGSLTCDGQGNPSASPLSPSHWGEVARMGPDG